MRVCCCSSEPASSDSSWTPKTPRVPPSSGRHHVEQTVLHIAWSLVTPHVEGEVHWVEVLIRRGARSKADQVAHLQTIHPTAMWVWDPVLGRSSHVQGGIQRFSALSTARVSDQTSSITVKHLMRVGLQRPNDPTAGCYAGSPVRPENI